jgi:hypothetical protein
VLAAAVRIVTMMYALNVEDHLHKEDALQQRTSTFVESFCCSYKQDCQAAPAKAGPTEVNGGTHWRTDSGFAAEYLRLGD